jgi:hypothetical protein
MAAQICILSVFVEGSKRDPSDNEVDMVYTWQCTRDKDVCFDTRSIDWKGWLAVLIFMLAYLLLDTINGIKMIRLSVKQRHGRNAQIRPFIGGTLVTCVSLFTTYVSTIYNSAITSSKLFEHYIIIQLAPFDYLLQYTQFLPSTKDNTEIIINSVIILFVCHLDELMYKILMVFPRWTKSISQEEVTGTDNGVFSSSGGLEVIEQQVTTLRGVNAKLETEVANLTEEFQNLSQNMEHLLEHIDALLLS